MRVIFLQDVPRVGKKYDIKEINDGYAMNFLFPRKLAESATPRAVAELEKRNKMREGWKRDRLNKKMGTTTSLSVIEKSPEVSKLFEQI